MKNVKSNFAVLIGIVLSFSTLGQQSVDFKNVSHAEPLYVDLVQSLGASKGAKEWNVGFEMENTRKHTEHIFLVEYEFAPINRLGLEVEADFSITRFKDAKNPRNEHKLEALKFAGQYAFFISHKMRMTLAIGYSQHLELVAFQELNFSKTVQSTIYNPFFVAAKRLGKNMHTMVFTSTLLNQNLVVSNLQIQQQVNASVFYKFPMLKHTIGIEFNSRIQQHQFELTIRPQIKFRFNKHISLGILAGIPIIENQSGTSFFTRLIIIP